tara:strand:+ start:2671 stop:3372 length:702 start_codon:yes stop_codon:yes gene_type:complete
MKKVAIVQSNYIPWKGYFDMINMVDEFILYDDAQYTKRDWRNRNKIKTPKGLRWLTIPVSVKGKYYQKINETKINNIDWAKKHWSLILASYSKSDFFKIYSKFFEELYLDCKERYLSQINYRFIKKINKILGIKTKISHSIEFNIPNSDNTQKLISISKQAKADVYLSGPLAKNYLDLHLFKNSGIKIEWMNYDNYKEYNQKYPPFNHNVSIIDLMFNEGHNFKKYMKINNDK